MRSGTRVRASQPLTLLLALVLLAVFAAPAAAARNAPIKVMTRNLYLGADLTPAIVAGSQAEFALAGTHIWQTVQATNFPERARALAREIAQQDPDLIALQEAAIWRTGPPDGPPQLGGTPAGHVVYDYLRTLVRELHKRGADYVVVIAQEEADIEGITTLGFDVRLTQRDAILAKRSAVRDGSLFWTTTGGAHFPDEIQLEIPILGGVTTLQSTRGYVFADVNVNRRPFRFIATHLEAFSAGRAAQQAGFLAGFAASTEGQVILAGDLNSAPGDTSTTPRDSTPGGAAYAVLIAAGFSDTWVVANGDKPGFTNGFSELLDDPDPSVLSERLDDILARPAVKVLRAVVTGARRGDRTKSGLWPSDHAGVVATLQP
jgi:endonuclease/exonuclease/phosphatase family metal-dependent hydrolase